MKVTYIYPEAKDGFALRLAEFCDSNDSDEFADIAEQFSEVEEEEFDFNAHVESLDGFKKTQTLQPTPIKP